MSQYTPGSDGLLKPINAWLKDPKVSEILLNRPQEIWIEKDGKLTSHKVAEFTKAHLNRLFQLIANENQQILSKATPLLSGSLSDGKRVQLCLPPTSRYHTLSIRCQVVRDFTLADYKKNRFFRDTQIANINDASFASLTDTEKELVGLYRSKSWDTFVKRAIELKKNIVISGGTSSGKTTFLNGNYIQSYPKPNYLLFK